MFDRLRRPTIALAALGAALAASGPAEGQTWRTITSARQVWDREPMDVQIQFGLGELNVRPAAEPMLYQMELRYDEERVTPVSEYQADRRRLRLGVEGRDGARRLKHREGSRATIELTRTVPLDLDLDFGAGEADLDLGGIALRKLDLSTGASETRVRFGAANPVEAEWIRIHAGAAELEVVGLGNARAERFSFEGGVGSTVLDFSGRWDRNTTATVEMGVGSLTLRFPRDLGIRLNKDSFLTSFDSEGLIKRGSSFYSPNWDSAAHRLTVDVDAAFGSIKVEWTR